MTLVTDNNINIDGADDSNMKNERGILSRLLRIGSGLFLTSITSILTWLCLGFIIGETSISNVFSLTYAMQFVLSLIFAIFGSGANIKKEKENNQNAVGSGMLFGFVLSFIAMLFAIIFADGYISFFGFDVEFFRPYVIYTFALFFVQTNFKFILEKLYFEDKEKLGNILSIAFNLVNFALLVILCLVTKNFALSAIITLVVMFIIWLVTYIWQFEKFKLDFNILTNFKYCSADILGAIFMFFIYLFGLQTEFSMGEEYISASNLVTLCTDAQWSALNAISTVVKIDISKARLNFKKTVICSYIFSAINLLTTFIMFFSLFTFYGVELRYALIYLGLQVVDMLGWTFSNIMYEQIQLAFSSILNTLAFLCYEVIRVLFSLFLLSPYCTDIGQIVAGFLMFIFYLFILLKFHKIENGKLLKKEKSIKNSKKIEKNNEKT